MTSEKTLVTVSSSDSQIDLNQYVNGIENTFVAKRFNLSYVFFVAFLFNITFLTSISAQTTNADYQRAVGYTNNNLWNKRVFNLNTRVHWFEDQSGFWFVDYSQNGKAYKTVLFKDETVRPLIKQNLLAEKLSAETGKTVDGNQFSLSNIERLGTTELSFQFNGENYMFNSETERLQKKTETPEIADNDFEETSPDGKWIAFTKDHNLYIKSTETSEEFQLTKDGEKNFEYASYYGWYDIIEGENGDRPKHFYVNWSPDSQYIFANRVDLRDAEKMYLLDYSIDSLYKPKLLSYYRGSPGDTTLIKINPFIFNVTEKTKVAANLEEGTQVNNLSIRWAKNPDEVLTSFTERGFKKTTVKRRNLKTGEKTTLIEETSDTNIDNFEYRYLKEANALLFLSERSGWRQLYHVNLKTGKIKTLTNGDYYISELNHIDEATETVYFSANGKQSANNPYHNQVYSVNFNGKLKTLTPELVNHDVNFSEDGNYFVDNYSTINQPTKTVLRRSKDGKIVTELTSADVSAIKNTGWQVPQVFQFIAKDDKTPLYGALWKPTNFDAAKSYPIIDHSYTGPHTNMFPASFSRAFQNQALAELGFIVMMVDGLGTAKRSKEFHNHSYKNMGENLEDHVLAIQHLDKTYSWIDGSRVGVFGHSAGGFDTGRAMLAYPETYKVGVASSADHDFRMEKAWWPEMYQGWPIDDTYEDVSNITNAEKLEGKLLIVHGGIDDNVNPSATYKLAEAFIKADKQFDMLIIPSQRHGYRGDQRLYFSKKRWNYFVEHLKGDTPIWDFKWTADE